MKLVENWRRAWRWISVQSMVVAVAVQGAWAFIPDDLRASFPKDYLQAVTVLLLLVGVAGRLVKQTPEPPKDPT